MIKKDDGILYDFPCSYTFRCFEAEQYGEYLPSLEPPPKEQQDIQSPITQYRVVKVHDKQLTRKVNDLEGAIKYLLQKKDKPRDKYF